MAPKDENELRHMLKTAVYSGRPIAMRYPRGAGYGVAMDADLHSLEIGRGDLLEQGRDLVIVAIGSTVYPSLEAAGLLMESGIKASVINARFVKPLDSELILGEALRTGNVVTVEENALMGGFGSAVLELLEQERVTGVRIKRIGIPDRYIEHGSQSQLRKDLGLDAEGIAGTVKTFLNIKEKAAQNLSMVK